METNWRRIIIYLLIFFTVVGIIVAVILSSNLPSGGSGTTPTPSLSTSLSVTPSSGGGDTSTCVGKGSVRVSVKCRKDDTSVCPATSGANSVQNNMVGQEVCGNGDVGKCGFYEACAPVVQDGLSCNMSYPGLNEEIRALSFNNFTEGLFVGCDINNQVNNCFCDKGSNATTISSSGKVKCFEDTKVSGYYNYCGARTFSSGATPSTSVSVTPSESTKPTSTPTGSTTVCPTKPSCAGTLIVTTPNPDDSKACATYTCNPTTTQSVTPTTTVSQTPLPNTALLGSDDLDRLVLAIIMIVIGVIIYYLNLQNSIGDIVLKIFGKKATFKISALEKEVEQNEKSKFESKLKRNN